MENTTASSTTYSWRRNNNRTSNNSNNNTSGTRDIYEGNVPISDTGTRTTRTQAGTMISDTQKQQQQQQASSPSLSSLRRRQQQQQQQQQQQLYETSATTPTQQSASYQQQQRLSQQQQQQLQQVSGSNDRHSGNSGLYRTDMGDYGDTDTPSIASSVRGRDMLLSMKGTSGSTMGSSSLLMGNDSYRGGDLGMIPSRRDLLLMRQGGVGGMGGGYRGDYPGLSGIGGTGSYLSRGGGIGSDYLGLSPGAGSGGYGTLSGSGYDRGGTAGFDSTISPNMSQRMTMGYSNMTSSSNAPATGTGGGRSTGGSVDGGAGGGSGSRLGSPTVTPGGTRREGGGSAPPTAGATATATTTNTTDGTAESTTGSVLSRSTTNTMGRNLNDIPLTAEELAQAEREEELLLSLLIARRQRARTMAMEGMMLPRNSAGASLADDLARMKRDRALSMMDDSMLLSDLNTSSRGGGMGDLGSGSLHGSGAGTASTLRMRNMGLGSSSSRGLGMSSLYNDPMLGGLDYPGTGMYGAGSGYGAGSMMSDYPLDPSGPLPSLSRFGGGRDMLMGGGSGISSSRGLRGAMLPSAASAAIDPLGSSQSSLYTTGTSTNRFGTSSASARALDRRNQLYNDSLLMNGSGLPPVSGFSDTNSSYMGGSGRYSTGSSRQQQMLLNNNADLMGRRSLSPNRSRVRSMMDTGRGGGYGASSEYYNDPLISNDPSNLMMTGTNEMDLSDQDRLSGSKRPFEMSNDPASQSLYNNEMEQRQGAENPSDPSAGAPKPKRTHKKKPADMPRRPLSAYNLFFSEERERILAEIGGTSTSKTDPDAEDGADEQKEGDDKDTASKADGDDTGPPKALLRPLIPNQKKRRPHRKTHGAISFQQLARMVGERWKNLPADNRRYYETLAAEDMNRQKLAMEEYYSKQQQQQQQQSSNTSSTVPTIDENDDTEPPVPSDDCSGGTEKVIPGEEIRKDETTSKLQTQEAHGKTEQREPQQPSNEHPIYDDRIICKEKIDARATIARKMKKGKYVAPDLKAGGVDGADDSNTTSKPSKLIVDTTSKKRGTTDDTTILTKQPVSRAPQEKTKHNVAPTKQAAKIEPEGSEVPSTTD